jgi:uncharacterized protein YebE (UPF0316 family)
MDAAFFHSDIFKFIILPLIIFSTRICDVTLDTLRIIYVSRGLKFLAASIGFIEVLIWLFAITQIFKNLTNPLYYVAYAGGFAMGNFVGIFIEERMAIGTVVIRAITQKDATELIALLRSAGYGVTHVDAHGAQGPVKVIFTIVKRKDVDHVLGIIKSKNPLAFYTVEDVRSVREGVFQPSR